MALPATSSDISTYGLPSGGFVDYQGLGVVDPTTDQGAAQFNVSAADLAQLTRLGGRAWCQITTSATTPTLVKHNAMWGNGGGVAPVIARSGAGIFTVTFPATVTDPLGNSVTINLQDAHASIVGSSLAGFVQCAVTAANVVTVYTFTTGFAVNDIAGTTVRVVAW